MVCHRHKRDEDPHKKSNRHFTHMHTYTRIIGSYSKVLLCLSVSLASYYIWAIAQFVTQRRDDDHSSYDDRHMIVFLLIHNTLSSTYLRSHSDDNDDGRNRGLGVWVVDAVLSVCCLSCCTTIMITRSIGQIDQNCC